MNTQAHTATAPPNVVNSVVWALAAWCFIVLLVVLALWELAPPNPAAVTAPQAEFSAERALSHVRSITRSAHPAGSSANQAVQGYLVAQLSALGLNPQVFPAVGVSRRSRNIVIGNTQDIAGRLPGTANSRAIMLVAHYDSVESAPGAGDDAAGVAAILEAVRALRSGPSLKNDLIVLFTDAEEPGLLGAEAFAASHPWMRDVGLILNFEGRGNQGPSLLFETSRNNGPLMNAVGESASPPIGSSLFYALYQLLPNDTDFTVFLPSQTPGLNFAFGAGLEAYHSRLDTAENLSPASLQQHGSYALSLSRHFGQMDLAQLKQRAGDDVFFNWLGSGFIAYGERWVIPGEILVTLLLVCVILLSLRRPEVRIARILLALGPCLALLIAIPAVLAGAAWLLSQILAGHMIAGDSPANSYLLAGLILLGACTGTLLFAAFRKRFRVQELSLAGLIIVCVLSWAIALKLPGGSYLLLWPLLLVTAGLLVVVLMKRGERPRDQTLAGLAGTALTVLLFAPVAYLLYIFLTLQLMTIAIIGLMLGVFFLLCAPLMNVSVPPAKWRPAALILLIGALTSIGWGASLDHHSAEYPQSDILLYSLNADDHSGAWISYDQSLDRWTAPFFSNKQPRSQSAPNYLGGYERPVLLAAAAPLDLAPPVAEIQEDKKQGAVHNLRINVRSQRNARLLFLTLGKDVRLVSVKIGGRNIVARQNSGSVRLNLVGLDTKGADLSLTVNAPSGISFWLTDQSSGLPVGAQPRPNEFMAGFGSDVTLVSRKYSL